MVLGQSIIIECQANNSGILLWSSQLIVCTNLWFTFIFKGNLDTVIFSVHPRICVTSLEHLFSGSKKVVARLCAKPFDHTLVGLVWHHTPCYTGLTSVDTTEQNTAEKSWSTKYTFSHIHISSIGVELNFYQSLAPVSNICHSYIGRWVTHQWPTGDPHMPSSSFPAIPTSSLHCFQHSLYPHKCHVPISGTNIM